MSKLAVILCVALLASAANASYITSPVKAAQHKVDGIIDAAITEAKTKYAAAKEKAQDISEKVYAAAVEHAQKIADELTIILNKVQADLDKVTGKAEGVDVTECTKLAAHLDFTATSVLSNISKCVIDKVETGAGYVESMVNTWEGVLFNLTSLRAEAHHCADGVEGVLSAAQAVACVNFIGVKATLVTGLAVPSVAIDIGKLSFLLTTLQPSLVHCSAVSGLLTFHHEASTIVAKTKKCVQEKIDQHRDAEPEAHSKITEEPTTERPTTGPAVEPTTGPAVEPTTSPAVEPTTSPAVEPTTSPAVEPTTSPAVEPGTQGPSTTEEFYSTEDESANGDVHYDQESATNTESKRRYIYDLEALRSHE